MEMNVRLDPVVKKWSERMVSAGARFAEVKTCKVWHERCAVLEDNERNILVEYPVKKGLGSKVAWAIRKDVIPQSEVIWMRWYVD